LPETTQDLMQGGVLIDTGEGIEVAFGRSAADLSAAMQIGDAAA
jgi:hypothetical protein